MKRDHLLAWGSLAWKARAASSLQGWITRQLHSWGLCLPSSPCTSFQTQPPTDSSRSPPFHFSLPAAARVQGSRQTPSCLNSRCSDRRTTAHSPARATMDPASAKTTCPQERSRALCKKSLHKPCPHLSTQQIHQEHCPHAGGIWVKRQVGPISSTLTRRHCPKSQGTPPFRAASNPQGACMEPHTDASPRFLLP